MTLAPSLCLIHGWGADARSWSTSAGILATRYAVHAPDLPAHGRRTAEPWPEPLTVSAVAEDVADRLAGGRTFLAGHSMGGQVAVRLALERPDQVAALVVVDPAYGAEPAEMELAPSRLADLRARATAAGVHFVDAAFPLRRPLGLWRAAREQMARTPGPALADLYESMYLAPSSIGPTAAAADALADLARLAIPVLSLYSSAGAARVAGQFTFAPGSRIEVWPGTTHYLHQQRPAAFARLVDTWLSSV